MRSSFSVETVRVTGFMKNRNGVDLSSLPQRILERLDRSAALTRPETKHDPCQVNHVTISNRAGRLAPRQLQLHNAIELLKPGLNPLWLLKARVRNHRPAAFTIFQQPLHCPVINAASSANQPGSTLRQERRQVLLEGIVIASLGVVSGGLGGYAFARLIGSYVMPVQLPGSIPIVGAAAVLIGAATIASYIPALRASRVDVIQALRTE